MHRDIKKNKAKLYETLRRIQGATLLTWKKFKPVLTTTESEETISLGATTEIHLLISSRYYTWFVFPPISPLSSWVHRLPCASFIQAYQGKVPKEKQKALMKQEEENKVTGSNLEISSRLRGRSMVSKNSKMKNIFHLPFLKHMHFSTMQNYLTREIKVLLRETKITGSNNKNPNSICGIAFVPRPFLFSAGGTEGKRRESKRYYKKKKKRRGGILGTKCTSDSAPHVVKMKQDPIGSFWTYDPPKASCQLGISRRKWTTLQCSETLA